MRYSTLGMLGDVVAVGVPIGVSRETSPERFRCSCPGNSSLFLMCSETEASWIRVEEKLMHATSTEPSFHDATSATQMSEERCLRLYKQRNTRTARNFQGLQNERVPACSNHLRYLYMSPITTLSLLLPPILDGRKRDAATVGAPSAKRTLKRRTHILACPVCSCLASSLEAVSTSLLLLLVLSCAARHVPSVAPDNLGFDTFFGIPLWS